MNLSDEYDRVTMKAIVIEIPISTMIGCGRYIDSSVEAISISSPDIKIVRCVMIFFSYYFLLGYMYCGHI